MRLLATGKTDLGRRRDQNEDALLVDDELGLYVVCDGMGGHAAGEVASRTAIETIRARVRVRLPSVVAIEPPERRVAALAELLRDAVERANAKIFGFGARDPEQRGAGTTCTALLVSGSAAVLAHVGDSRLYLLRGDGCHQISTDHTFIAEALRRGLRGPELAHLSPNMLTRAVGPHERVDIDTLTFELVPGDRLVLCSDGLHGYLKHAGDLAVGHGDVAGAAERLVALANERGGEDNISVVVIEAVDEPAEEETARISHVAEDLRALSEIELLSELTYAELLQVAAALRTQEHERDEVVFREGDVGSALHIVAAGSVHVERGGTRLTRLSAGSHFGEMALLTARPRSATVRVVEPCRLLVLDRDALFALFRESPVIAVKFLWRLAARQSLRLDETTEWLRAGGDLAPDTAVSSDRLASPFSRKPT